MAIIDDIKKSSIELRKSKSNLASFSTFVLSEVENIGKNNGNRQTTDAETISKIKKMIGNNKSNIAMTNDGFTIMKLEAENDFMRSFLPEMASEKEVIEFLKKEFGLDTPSNKGIIMGALKRKFGMLVDMKQASEIVKDLFDM